MGMLPNLFLKPAEPAVTRIVERVVQGGSFAPGAMTRRAPAVTIGEAGATLPVTAGVPVVK
jgi:hypothetical protein